MNLPTIDSVTAPYLHFPAVVQRAVLLVDTHPTFNALTRATRRVLKALMTRAEKTNGRKPIQARVDRLRREAECSEKTVQRALHTLCEIGWVCKMSDGRNDAGEFCGYTLQFSGELCEMVQLPTEDARPHQTTMSDGVYVDLNFRNHQLETRAKARKAKPEPQEVQLPAELAKLPEELAISAPGIAKLRGLASQAGHQLADIVAVARKHLQHLKIAGNRAYDYLAAMISKPADYRHRAGEIAAEAAHKARAEKRKDQEATYTGRRFVDREGATIRILGANAEVWNPDGSFRGTVAGREQMATLYAAIEAGKLREIANARLAA